MKRWEIKTLPRRSKLWHPCKIKYRARGRQRRDDSNKRMERLSEHEAIALGFSQWVDVAERRAEIEELLFALEQRDVPFFYEDGYLEFFAAPNRDTLDRANALGLTITVFSDDGEPHTTAEVDDKYESGEWDETIDPPNNWSEGDYLDALAEAFGYN